MNKVVLFLVVGMMGLAVRGSIAQELLGSPGMDDLPPERSFSTSGKPSELTAPEELEPIAAPDSYGIPGEGNVYFGLDPDQDFRAFDCSPALLESTGTWFRRGFWFAEADAVLFNRRFGKNRTILLSDASVQANIQPQSQLDLATNQVHFNRNALAIVEDKPGTEGIPRLKVGRFLYRDHENRDHNLEFTIFGGGNWAQSGQLEGEDLVSRIVIDSNNLSFDGAQSSQYTYDSWLNSFELNYHIHQRMLKDRMELEPSGHWVRRAQPSRTTSFLAGVRYMDLTEDFDWDAFGIDNNTITDGTGFYDIEVGNHLLGTQLGLSSSYETARWSLTAAAKGGMYLNMIGRNIDFNVADVNSGQTDDEADNLAWIGEASVLLRWHIHSNVSLRTGLELMHVAGVSLAPRQIDFVPGVSPNFPMGGDILYVGGSIGLESYW